MDQDEWIFGPNEKPYNQEYREWVEKWWSWLLQIPDAVNPSNDSTGKNSDIEQNDPNVWYLAGAHIQKPYHTMATVERRCYIPGGKSLGLALAANECSLAEFPYMSTDELKKYAEAGDHVKSLTLSIDGKTFKSLEEYSARTALFDVIFPKDNLFDAPAGPTKVCGHAFMVIVKPLTPGLHEVVFSQFTEADPASRTPAFGYHVTYHLDVFPRT